MAHMPRGGTGSIHDGDGPTELQIANPKKNTQACQKVEDAKKIPQALKSSTQKQDYKCTLYCLLPLNWISLLLRRGTNGNMRNF